MNLILWSTYKFIVTLLLLIPNSILKIKKKTIIVVDAGGIGDSLSLTAFTDFLYTTKKIKTIIFTPHPDIFLNNPSIHKIISKKKAAKNKLKYRFILMLAKFSPYANFLLYGYVNQTKNSYLEETKKGIKLRLREFNLRHTVHFDSIVNKELKPKIYFSKKEILSYSKLTKNLPEHFGITMSNAKKSFSVIKDWGWENFQKVANKKQIPWVQIGTKDDYKLENVFDKRGLSLRESLFIISKSKIVLCSEGFFSHASACFNIPCITVTSGFVPPLMTKYNNVTHIEREPKLSCRYCGATKKCPLYKEPICITEISPETVSKKISSLLLK